MNFKKLMFFVLMLLLFHQNVVSAQTLTRMEFKAMQYDSAGGLIDFTHALATDIKANPLKVNLQGTFENEALEGTNVLVEYEVTSYKTYTDDLNINKTIQNYTQTTTTKTNRMNYSKDIYLSTKSRVDKTTDIADSTVYLEDDTQYYVIKVKVYNDGVLYLQRSHNFLIQGPQNEPINWTPTAPINGYISTYLKDPNNGNAPMKTLEITARDLNSKNGIDLLIEGYAKNNWINDEVLVKYEIYALNTYTNYIDGSGTKISLSVDPDADVGDENQMLVSSMTEWYGTEPQLGFLKRYISSSYTQNNYESFEKSLTLRTKLDIGNYPNDKSVVFLDNVARDYQIKITVTNLVTNEILSETLDLNIVTVLNSQNSIPYFNDGTTNIGISKPQKDSNFNLGEYVPVEWTGAIDTDNTSTQKEYMYYKLYYSYVDSTGDIVKKYIKRYDDIPKGAEPLTTQFFLDNSNQIDKVTLKIKPCDINHVCGEFTNSNEFSFNSTTNDSNEGSFSSISIEPGPTGKWENTDIEVFVTYEGDLSLLTSVQKKYTITNSASVPSAFNQILGTNNTIKISSDGENYVHVKYILSNGDEIYASSGPYKLYKNQLSDFTMSIKDVNGNVITDWTNQPIYLDMGYMGNELDEGIEKYYRIENYHNEWQPYTLLKEINVEGNYKIYGKIVNKAGTTSEQKEITAKSDKGYPLIKSLKLKKETDGTYTVVAYVTDSLSGIKSLVLNDGTSLKRLSSTSYSIDKLTIMPNSITVTDNANNSINSIFAEEPSITLSTTEKTRTDVVATIDGTGDLIYRLYNEYNNCLVKPCDVNIERNTLFSVLNKQDILETQVDRYIENIDKSELNLILIGERDLTDETIINFDWNYDLSSGTLTCDDGTNINNFIVSGTSATMNGQNITYHCSLEGYYAGELTYSNLVTIYPDLNQPMPTDGSLIDTSVSGNVYVEESRIGRSYFINTRRNNTDNKNVPIPQSIFD